MALEASHIRFALDLKDAYGVSDIDAFVAGSIYPDSRYVSGIGRMETHPDDYLDDSVFNSSDFKKGWHAHLLCDTVQGACMKELLPTVKTGEGEESWIERTAIKILQDIEDAKKFDLAAHLPLRHAENPNGEPIEKINEYHAIFPSMYRDPQSVSVEDAHDMWLKFGVPEETVVKVRDTVERFSKDLDIVAGVSKLYDTMLLRARELLK